MNKITNRKSYKMFETIWDAISTLPPDKAIQILYNELDRHRMFSSRRMSEYAKESMEALISIKSPVNQHHEEV